MTEELKPCPFCGGIPEISSSLHGQVVCCVNCFTHSHDVERTGKTVPDAIKAWNTRHVGEGLAVVDAKLITAFSKLTLEAGWFKQDEIGTDLIEAIDAAKKELSNWSPS